MVTVCVFPVLPAVTQFLILRLSNLPLEAVTLYTLGLP